MIQKMILSHQQKAQPAQLVAKLLQLMSNEIWW
jgi:hypothetical protein